MAIRVVAQIVFGLFSVISIVSTSGVFASMPNEGIKFSKQVINAEDFLKEEWTVFSCNYPFLGSFSPEEIATLANQWGKKVAKSLLVSETIREVDPIVIKRLVTLLKEEELKVFMRHGEQQKTERIEQLSTELQKIEMMRLPDNFENSLTKTSIAELFEGMIIWEYLRQKTDHPFVVHSSKNKRAALPANALAYTLKTDVKISKNLNCVNYPSSDKMSTIEILKYLPDGTLPWEKQKVDIVIGLGTYDYIKEEMEKLLFSRNYANDIAVFITHTQQINAIAVLLGLPATRLGNFGFVVVTNQSKEVFSDGFYKKK